MQEMIHKLSHIGLSEKEASVYIASLEIGPSVAQDIAKKARVNRATTYVMIESLSSRGLMSSFSKGKKRYFSAESPERLLSVLNVQQKEIEEKAREIKTIIPKLQAIYNSEGERPDVRLLEGPEGIQAAREVFHHIEGEFIEIVPIEDARQFQDVMQGRDEHINELKRRDAKFRILAVMKEPDITKLSDMPGGEVRIIPQSKFPIHGEITVRGNFIYMFSYKSVVLSLVITSKELADTIRALFDLAWEGAEKYKKD